MIGALADGRNSGLASSGVHHMHFHVLSLCIFISPGNCGRSLWYDVLRALNNPLVFRGAKKHFGQQLLNHLHTLD